LNSFYDKTSEYLQTMNLFIKYAQGYSPKIELVDLNEFVESEFIKYKNTFAYSDLKLELNLSPEEPVINADIKTLQEAVFVIMLHYLTYIQEHCAKITFRTFFNNKSIFFEIEVKCNESDIPEFSEGLSLNIISMISEVNSMEIKTLKITDEGLIKISLIFK